MSHSNANKKNWRKVKAEANQPLLAWEIELLLYDEEATTGTTEDK